MWTTRNNCGQHLSYYIADSIEKKREDTTKTSTLTFKDKNGLDLKNHS